MRRKSTESDERYAAQLEGPGMQMKNIGSKEVLIIEFVVPIAVNIQYRTLERP